MKVNSLNFEQQKMKNHLINLLLEEYKQYCLFEELEQRGISLERVKVDIYTIVLDMIGFPRESNESAVPYPDPSLFNRDFIDDKYVEMFSSKKLKISFSSEGLTIEDEADKKIAREKLSDFIDWLYHKFEEIEN